MTDHPVGQWVEQHVNTHKKRVLVTGSRDWPDYQKVWDALEPYQGFATVIVHGDCPTGVDLHAKQWCARTWTLEEPHPADWSKGRKAGPERNRHMVSLGADVCLAFISRCTSPRCHIKGEHDSHGATGCANLAEKAGITVERYRV